MSTIDHMRTTVRLGFDAAIYDDDHETLLALRGGDGDYIHPELERRVAEAIRRYPDSDAPAWLSPVAAILEVERWLVVRGTPNGIPEQSPRQSPPAGAVAYEYWQARTDARQSPSAR